MTMAHQTSPRKHKDESGHPTARGLSARRLLTVSAIGVAAIALAACSSSSASTTTSTPPTGSAGTGSGGAAQRQVPGANGTIAAISGTSLEVQNANTGQTTVTYTGSTTFKQTTKGTSADVTVGSCISAFGKPTSGSTSSMSAQGAPITATTVTISQPTSGTCSNGFGAGGFRPGQGGVPGGPPSGGEFPAGGPSGAPNGGKRPTGARDFGAASGAVTAVNGSTITVDETNPRTKKATAVTVTLTGSSSFTVTQSATSSDLAVGKCAQAIGTASTTGAITAQTITVSTAGASGCSSDFGGFPGGGSGPGSVGGA